MLIRATHHVINQSNTVELHMHAKHVCFYFFQRALGIGLKGRMHSRDIKMGPDARNLTGASEQQRRRPVFVSTQSDQRLYCSLIRKFNI